MTRTHYNILGALLFTALLVLNFTCAAQASTHVERTPAGRYALQASALYWQGQASERGCTLGHRPSLIVLSPKSWRRWESRSRDVNTFAGFAVTGFCTIYISREEWQTDLFLEDPIYGWRSGLKRFCTLVAHEDGHVRGYEHSDWWRFPVMGIGINRLATPDVCSKPPHAAHRWALRQAHKLEHRWRLD